MSEGTSSAQGKIARELVNQNLTSLTYTANVDTHTAFLVKKMLTCQLNVS